MSTKAHNEAEPKATVKKPVTKLFNLKVVAADTATAAVVGCVVSVPISIIDYAIMAKVAGVVPSMGKQVVEGVKTLLTNPKNFFFVDTPTTRYSFVYKLCLAVYFNTYLVANISRSYMEGSQHLNAEQTALRTGVTSSAVNVGVTIWKDSNILGCMPSAATTKEGAAASAAAKVAEKAFVPMLSRVGFAVRDTMTCVAAFTAVPLLKDYLAETYPSLSARQCQTISSIGVPCAVQVASTLIYVPAIKYQRLYNPNRQWGGPEGYLAAFAHAIKTDYMGALRLRVLRIFFAFGCGTILNSELRPKFIRAIEPKAM